MSNPTAQVVTDFIEVTETPQQAAILNERLRGVQKTIEDNGGTAPVVLVGEPGVQPKGLWSVPAILMDGIIRFEDLWGANPGERSILSLGDLPDLTALFDPHVHDLSTVVVADAYQSKAGPEAALPAAMMAFSENMARAFQLALSSILAGISAIPQDVRVARSIFSSFPAFIKGYSEAMNGRLNSYGPMDFCITAPGDDNLTIYDAEGTRKLVSHHMKDPVDPITLLKILTPPHLQVALLMAATINLKTVSDCFGYYGADDKLDLDETDEIMAKRIDMICKALDYDFWADVDAVSSMVLKVGSSDSPYLDISRMQDSLISSFGLGSCFRWDPCVTPLEGEKAPWAQFPKKVLGLERAVKELGFSVDKIRTSKDLPDDLESFDFSKAMESGAFGKVSEEVH
jgi:hypothetical protein